MPFLGWIWLAWPSGAEGREADRQMDPRARRRHVGGCRRLATWGRDTLLGGREAGVPTPPTPEDTHHETCDAPSTPAPRFLSSC